MYLNNDYSHNNTSFGAKLTFYNHKSRQAIEKFIPPERWESITKRFELMTRDYPDDTLTLSKQGIRCEIHNDNLYSYKDETILDLCKKLGKLRDNEIVTKLLKLYEYYRIESDAYLKALRFAEKQGKIYFQDKTLMSILTETFRSKYQSTRKYIHEDNIFRWLRSTGHSYITYKNGDKIHTFV